VSVVFHALGTPALLLIATTQAGTETDPEETRELVGQLLGFLGVTVGVVILLLVLGLPLRSWLRQRRQRDGRD
jgi:L-lactate permease